MAEIKAEHFAEWSTDELMCTHDEAADLRQILGKRLSAPRLTWVVLLRSLVRLRENVKKAKLRTA